MQGFSKFDFWFSILQWTSFWVPDQGSDLLNFPDSILNSLGFSDCSFYVASFYAGMLSDIVPELHAILDLVGCFVDTLQYLVHNWALIRLRSLYVSLRFCLWSLGLLVPIHQRNKDDQLGIILCPSCSDWERELSRQNPSVHCTAESRCKCSQFIPRHEIQDFLLRSRCNCYSVYNFSISDNIRDTVEAKFFNRSDLPGKRTLHRGAYRLNWLAHRNRWIRSVSQKSNISIAGTCSEGKALR